MYSRKLSGFLDSTKHLDVIHGYNGIKEAIQNINKQGEIIITISIRETKRDELKHEVEMAQVTGLQIKGFIFLV